MKIENGKVRAGLLGPAFIVGLALAVYLGITLIRAGGDPLTFAQIGDGFRDGQPLGQNEGYDGQFPYFIALDPRPAVVGERLDVPAYRYQRILYPLLARLLALGQPNLIPWTLVAVNVVAQIVGTYLVELWLMMHGVSRWYALTYGLWAGLLMAVRLDLNEPVCYALVAGALVAHQRSRFGLSALCLGLALFAKETALLFWIALIVSLMLTRTMCPSFFTLSSRSIPLGSLHLVTLSILPFIAFQLFLYRTFGSLGLTSGGYLATPFEIIPYMGLWRIGLVSLPAFALLAAIFVPMVVLPSLWGIIAALRRLWQRDFSVAVCALAVNAGFIPFAPFSTFREPLGLIRLVIGLVLATILYGAHTKSSRVLNYSLLWMAGLVFLLKE